MSKRTPEKSINFLKKSLDRSEKELLEISHIIATTKETSNAFWSSLKRRASKAYEESRIIYSEWNKSEIPHFYKENIRRQIKKIKGLSFTTPKKIDYVKFINKDVHKRTIAIILEDSISSYIIGSLAGQKTFNRLLGLTQQLLITEKELNAAIVEGFQESGSIFGARKKLQQEFLKKSLDGKYITIIDKNGKPINYTIKGYSEMVARTKLIKAQSDGTVNLSLAYGNDLVQVSAHNTITPFDAQFEGKVFSLSGKDKDFPAAGFLPPFHPNCLHTLSIYFKEAHTNKQNEAISDYSLDKTEIHPTRKSQIPISQMEKGLRELQKQRKLQGK